MATTQPPPEDPTAALAAARSDGKLHLLLAASGSVATIKLPEIARALSARHHARLSIRILLTESAKHFLSGQSAEQPAFASLQALPGVDAVYDDASEWGPTPWRRGRPILHIEARRWADLLVVAPLDANTLAKIVNGLCDNLLTSVVRAWDAEGGGGGGGDGDGEGRRKRVIVVAPAMNTAMWRHPVTRKQVRVLEEEWGVGVEGGWFEVLRPKEGVLACGDTGAGAMHDWQGIVRVIEERLGL